MEEIVHIRSYQIRDTEAIMQLFYDTIHEVNIRDYSTAQVDVWAPRSTNVEDWKQSLSSKLTYVAEANETIVGFAELEANGHIDRFYCHKNSQRQGVGTQMLKQLELKAIALGIKRLFTEASITAKPFFESQRFVVIKQQEVERKGQKFINYVMEKYV